MDQGPKVITKREIVVEGVTCLINRITSQQFSLQFYKIGEPNKIDVINKIKNLSGVVDEGRPDESPDSLKLLKINLEQASTVDDVEKMLRDACK